MPPFLNQTGFYILDTCTGDTEQLHATLRLNTEHAIYDGHFPGRPITPGVCLYQIIKEVAMIGWVTSLRLLQVKSIKFLRLLPPGDGETTLQLQGQWLDATTVSVTATVQAEKQLVCKASVIFTTLPYS